MQLTLNDSERNPRLAPHLTAHSALENPEVYSIFFFFHRGTPFPLRFGRPLGSCGLWAVKTELCPVTLTVIDGCWRFYLHLRTLLVFENNTPLRVYLP